MGNLVLVDQYDNEIGSEEKLKVHTIGKLHRAFSIFIFNSKKELLLQKRAKCKYHSGGLWSNTCCSHPNLEENLELAIHKRLEEEMGFDCKLQEVYSFIYKEQFDNGLIEHEYDHVYIGNFDGLPRPNHSEVEVVKWENIDFIAEDIVINPEKYTCWFKITFKDVVKALNGNLHKDSGKNK
ncbi:isopentenyl-diphosphate delta-isomerase [Ruminiclostridium sufflavum DSM 19573]|uniref:Isopentenyl-diphosphate delta-isomerase n=1 Tax=Ruminiclostridium sufflavum DSM 19573 TaxID=1121337 RepID=A0A318XPL9_9FIRM|nr:isopentenyl-diphosphate Delta-isomerase [Ruminiclostridium sufflavum]PYG88032.1 isopentenyl-diphosphate delta-isomerase [Ruminiclostridium sufflavum DSM 19573]